jgi:hypothetical protein
MNSLQLAMQGDAEAIAALVNRALQPQGIQVAAVSVKDDRLHLVLESAQTPNQETVGGALWKSAAPIHSSVGTGD